MFEATVRLGDIITLLGMGAGGLMVFSTLRSAVINQGDDIKGIKIELAKQTQILVSIARQDEKISALEKRVDDMHRAR